MRQCSTCKIVKPINDYYQTKKHVCKDCCKQQASKWVNNNRERSKELTRVRKEQGNQTTQKASKRYYDKNRKDIIAKGCTWKKQKRISDPLFALQENMRSLIWSAFINRGFRKQNSSECILGCSYEEFKKYIESLFEPWMTWENRNKYDGTPKSGWDIDHIVPVSQAETSEDLIRLNHYTNLRPLCSYQNRIVKRNKI